MKYALPSLLLVLCACATGVAQPERCFSDEQCPGELLCFAEGCGDPGAGVVVEVTGGALITHAARDFAIEDGSLSREQFFELREPLTVSGTFQRELSAEPNPLFRTTYAAPVTIRAEGASALLPGITRSVQTRIEDPEGGFYELKLPSGNYTLTAFPKDVTVPPVSTGGPVEPTQASTTIDFVFPAESGATQLTGQLIKRTDSSLVPPEPVLLNEGYESGAAPAIEVQLLDSASKPMSQRVELRSTGEFSLTVSPDAQRQESLILVAGPRDPGEPVPTRRFNLTTPLPPAISREIGDFGNPGEVSGTIVDSEGAAVAGAQVLIDGTVRGDGFFRSKVAITGDDGRFTLKVLPSRTAFTLNVVPPRLSRAAATQLAVTVNETEGGLKLAPETISLGDRLVVRGRVVQPDGAPAANALVRALPYERSLASPSLPQEIAETQTLADGTFSLPMDTGSWHFEFWPGALLPLASRLVTVEREVDDEGLSKPEFELPDVVLSYGRTVTGRVTASTRAKQSEAAYAQLRFFRVTSIDGVPASILLGTAIADERGAYKVVLPSKTPEP